MFRISVAVLSHQRPIAAATTIPSADSSNDAAADVTVVRPFVTSVGRLVAGQPGRLVAGAGATVGN